MNYIFVVGIGAILTVLSMMIGLSFLLPIHAQTTNATNNLKQQGLASQQLPINFTKYFEQNKYYQLCVRENCFGPSTEVLFQSAHTLALKSTFIDAIWKAVDFAKTQGYHVDGITSYIASSGIERGGSVNILVLMSR